jgi:hypothetical protein
VEGWLITWATLSPGGRRRWAALAAQPLVFGPGAHAAASRFFAAGPFRSVVNSSFIFHLSFEFQKLFCVVFLVFFAVFHVS